MIFPSHGVLINDYPVVKVRPAGPNMIYVSVVDGSESRIKTRSLTGMDRLWRCRILSPKECSNTGVVEPIRSNVGGSLGLSTVSCYCISCFGALVAIACRIGVVLVLASCGWERKASRLDLNEFQGPWRSLYTYPSSAVE